MKVNNKGKYHLVVRDTGIGFTKNLDSHQTEAIGMQLGTDLTSQLEGRVTLKREGGTEFKLVF